MCTLHKLCSNGQTKSSGGLPWASQSMQGAKKPLPSAFYSGRSRLRTCLTLVGIIKLGPPSTFIQPSAQMVCVWNGCLPESLSKQASGASLSQLLKIQDVGGRHSKLDINRESISSLSAKGGEGGSCGGVVGGRVSLTMCPALGAKY